MAASGQLRYFTKDSFGEANPVTWRNQINISMMTALVGLQTFVSYLLSVYTRWERMVEQPWERLAPRI